MERKIIVPGETIMTGEEFLPGNGTRREGKDIVASRFGLVDISEKLIRVIPLSGVYIPRRGNTIIGQVIDVNFSGWMIDFNGPANGFITLGEFPGYVNKDEMRDRLDFGDMVVAKIVNTSGKSIDLTLKMRGLGRIDDGMIIKINPNKVPRVIGKEGSMVTTIKEITRAEITVGQNGLISIEGKTIEDELNTKKIIEFICNNSYVEGLTERIKEYAEKELKIGEKDE
jgi:exosome complex component RRP4